MARVVNAVFRKAGVYEITLTVVDGGTSLQRDSETFEVTARIESKPVSSRRIQLGGRSGVNRITVQGVSVGSRPAAVTLDFGNTSRLILGSLAVREGEVVALGPRKVVLQLVGRGRIEYSLR